MGSSSSTAAPPPPPPPPPRDGRAPNPDTLMAAAVLFGLVLEPANGSWVAELQDAKAALVRALRGGEKRSERERNDDGAAAEAEAEAEDLDPTDDSTLAVLRAHLRLCRAYRVLRQWDRLVGASLDGTDVCDEFSSSSTATAATRRSPGPAAMTSGAPEGHPLASVAAAAAAAAFRKYRKLAEAERRHADAAIHGAIRHCVLNGGDIPKGLAFGGDTSLAAASLASATVLHEAVANGEVRLMEVVVALGAPVDQPSAEPPEGEEMPLPPGVSALVMACAILAEAASIDLEDQILSQDLDRVAECAMQLVRLGADINVKLPEDAVHVPFGGKSPFQIAAMSQRRPLVALMLEHMQMGAEERADIVHCRCGSRLPWKKCHATGVGQPPHFLLDSTTGETCYRVSPHGPCPCECTNKTYYKCCWKDNRVPVYMSDTSGELLCRSVDVPSLPELGRCLADLAVHESGAAAATVLRTCHQGSGWIRPCARLLREHPTLFEALCDDVGPESRMTHWDPAVYAGCVERLEVPFLWRDVHWDLDHSVLLQRTEEWNDALHDYCDDVGLNGVERELVVRLHTADPCGPCGYGGCFAYESEVREFRRCAGCKAIAYCSHKCQEKDWANHKMACQACHIDSPVLVPYVADGPVNLGQG